MKHLGDICKINGAEIPVVDVIVGGSPCQDLSVAGKREGLSGERSGLFMEQVRIVKEMREAYALRTNIDARFIKPRFLLWENVPGALSSGKPKGADFQAVLTEICKVVCKESPDVPIPTEGWHNSGCISGVGDSGVPFSIAWVITDACKWGVPQRRKRIALLADFNGYEAPNILFKPTLLGEPRRTKSDQTVGHTGERWGRPSVQSECESMSWDSEQSIEEGQGIAGDSEDRPFATDIL